MAQEDFNIQKLEEDIQGYIKRLKEEQSRLLASINSLPLGFIIIDVKNNILIKNPAIDKILGIGDELPGSVLLRGDISVIENKFAGSWDLKANWEACLNEKKLIDAKEVNLGKLVLHLFLAPIIAENAAIGVVVLAEDITEAKILERAREEFFAIASHELRTPLTAIRGNMALIKDFYKDPLAKDPQLKEMIEDSYNGSIRLIGIVNDFLDMSRLEQGRVTFKKDKIDLAELVKEVSKEVAPIVESKKLVLNIKDGLENPVFVFADRDRAKQIVYNLISNALNYTQKGEVDIKARKEDNMFKVFVSDTGDGISKENQTLLFRKFQQAGEKVLARDASKSTGLGLYISKLIADAMGGKIWLENSEFGKGSVFAFALPLAL